MLTNLNFLSIGEKFPPPCEFERLQMYRANRSLFEGDHAIVYAEAFKRIERVIGNFKQIVSYPIVLNFQKLMSLKIADLLLGETPIISAGEAESAEQKSLDTIVRKSDLFNVLYAVALDISRYGDGLLHIKDSLKISPAQPVLWFPIVDPLDVWNVLYHVFARTEEVTVGDKKLTMLYVTIHSKGSYESREYTLDGQTITGLQGAPITTSTGLDDFDIIAIPNTITSDRATGIDDYTDIDSIMTELLVRVGQIERILDKHANPSMQGPPGALEQDPDTGEWRLKVGTYFPRNDKDDVPVEYLTWESQLDANFNMIDRLVKFLYTLTEMGSALFGDQEANPGQVPSGTALRRLMMSPLAKVNRIRMRFDPAIKKALSLCSKLGGPGVIAVEPEKISITWQDGLPGDPKEEAEIISSRTGGKSTMSQFRALKTFDHLTSKDAEDEIDRILEESEAANPFPMTPIGGAPSQEPTPEEPTPEE